MNYLKGLIITFTGLLITTFVFGSFSYSNVISENILYIIQIIMLFSIIAFESYNLGKKKDKKGYIEGLIFGTIISLIFLLINILFIKNIDIYKIFYYLFIIILSTLSSIIGINKKMKD